MAASSSHFGVDGKSMMKKKLFDESISFRGFSTVGTADSEALYKISKQCECYVQII